MKELTSKNLRPPDCLWLSSGHLSQPQYFKHAFYNNTIIINICVCTRIRRPEVRPQEPSPCDLKQDVVSEPQKSSHHCLSSTRLQAHTTTSINIIHVNNKIHGIPSDSLGAGQLSLRTKWPHLGGRRQACLCFSSRFHLSCPIFPQHYFSINSPNPLDYSFSFTGIVANENINGNEKYWAAVIPPLHPPAESRCFPSHPTLV